MGTWVDRRARSLRPPFVPVSQVDHSKPWGGALAPSGAKKRGTSVFCPSHLVILGALRIRHCILRRGTSGGKYIGCDKRELIVPHPCAALKPTRICASLPGTELIASDSTPCWNATSFPRWLLGGRLLQEEYTPNVCSAMVSHEKADSAAWRPFLPIHRACSKFPNMVPMPHATESGLGQTL